MERRFQGGDWSLETGTIQGLTNITQLGSHNQTNNAKAIRENFRNFFCSIGEFLRQCKAIANTYNYFDNVK